MSRSAGQSCRCVQDNSPDSCRGAFAVTHALRSNEAVQMATKLNSNRLADADYDRTIRRELIADYFSLTRRRSCERVLEFGIITL